MGVWFAVKSAATVEDEEQTREQRGHGKVKLKRSYWRRRASGAAGRAPAGTDYCAMLGDR